MGESVSLCTEVEGKETKTFICLNVTLSAREECE